MQRGENQTVIILGMHRTGTSMTAGILQKPCINMGENLKEERPPNPLKYYENVEVIDFLKINPNKKQRRRAENFILPKEKIKKLSFRIKFKNWIKKAVVNPHNLPVYSFSKLKLIFDKMF